MPLMTGKLKKLLSWGFSGNFDLDANLATFFSLTSTFSEGATEANFRMILDKTYIFGNTLADITNFTWDKDITLTFRINGADTAKVLTIPASSGAGVVEEDTVIIGVKDDLIVFQVNGDAGVGAAVMKGFNQSISL